MSIDWKTLPSLTSLRAFEAAARVGSFSKAAQTLSVTHAAVAQQVRALEDHLGCELIFREGRGLQVTAEGAKLAGALGEAFRSIQTAVQEVTNHGAEAPLRVTMTPSFATQWLMPRLWDFWAQHPEIPLLLHPDKRVVDLRRDGIDIGLRFGNGKWPGVEAEFLTAARYVIIGAPELLEGRENLTREEMTKLPWVLEQDWPEAREWLKSYGLRPDDMEFAYMPNEELALSAAKQGYGLHIEALALVQQDVDDGYLIILDEIRDDRLAYYMVTRPGPKRTELRTFMAWLKSQV